MIGRFIGNYRFPSNFYPCKILYKKRVWPTAEHLFQALKTRSQMDRMRIRKCVTSGHAKKMGRQIKLRDNWNNIRLDIMRMVLSLKFEQNPKLGKKLFNTKNQILVEGNTWHDNFWGDCECDKCVSTVGENHLGKLLIQIRWELYKNDTQTH